MLFLYNSFLLFPLINLVKKLLILLVPVLGQRWETPMRMAEANWTNGVTVGSWTEMSGCLYEY